MRTRVTSTIALLMILGACHPTAAQTDRATIEGTVTDSSGATIANSRIQITRVETGLGEEKVTNNFGHYRFPAIAVGVYTVGVARDGFQTKQIEGVEVQVGETRKLDGALSVG